MDAIAKRIKKILIERDISIRQLGVLTGIPPATISRYVGTETKKIPIDKLELIADTLNVSLAYLLGMDIVNPHLCPDDENPWILEICELIEKENVDTQITVYEHVKSILKDNTNSPCLTPHETDVMKAYRDQPEMQPAVDRLLGISEDGYVTVYAAANSASNRKHAITQIPKEKWDEIENEPNTDEDLM